MQAQDLSYDLKNAKISLPLNNKKTTPEVSVEVFSFENVYTVEKDGFIEENKNHFVANSLLWGSQEKTKGKVELTIDEQHINVKAELDKNIRSVKVRFDNLPHGKLISTSDQDREITEYGLNLKYPEGWRSLSHPLLVFEINKKKYLFFRSLDKSVNQKYFFIKKTGKTMRLDFVQEQNGTIESKKFNVPTIEYGFASSKEEIYAAQRKYMEEIFGLKPFEESAIVPSWLKDISLVVTVHMQTFTGYIFNTYEKVYEEIEKLSKFVNPKRILVYLAGWEGRYYYKYGNYCPDERMGGAKALKETVNKLHKLGCKVMAMYGINLVNMNLPNIKPILEKAEFQSTSGAKFHNGSVDWEGAHHYDFNELRNLNFASKLWQDELVRQITENTKTFDFDGAFLDIAACFINDKNNSTFEGLCQLCDRLRQIKKDFLVGGEGYYDGMSKTIPLFQSGHTDGKMNYHDRMDEELFSKYSREFAHLCLGDPSRGSTGVHEQGTNTDYKTPIRKGIIPTLSIVEDSILPDNKRFKEIIAGVREYERRFL
ncbi:MAG TPA: DUF6259 domain-containing protein [Candidatus Paceibacterota bacterium]|jgi:hypothetical protein|nr:DUF6259 domain-containing protein [Candidatus Paceibacterota bacterium]